MKLTKAPSRIVGVRVGEIEADMITSPLPRLLVRFVLLRDPEKSDGINAGQYVKDRDFSPKAVEAFENFVGVLEEEVLVELFETEDTRLPLPEVEKEADGEEQERQAKEDSLHFPTLGGGRGTPQL